MRLFVHFLTYGGGLFVSRLGAFLLVPILTRILTPYEFGAADLISSLVAIGSIVGMLQMDSAVSRFHHDSKSLNELDELYSAAIANVGLSSFILMIALWVSAESLSILFFRTASLGEAIQVASLNIVIVNFMTLLSIRFRFENRPITFFSVTAIQTLFAVVLSLIFVWRYGMNVEGLFLAQVLSAFISLAVAYFAKPKFRFAVFNPNLAKQLFKYSWPLIPATLLVWGQNYFFRFVINTMSDTESVGMVGLASRISSITATLQTAFQLAWIPYLMQVVRAQGADTDLRRKFHTLAFFFFVAASLVSLFSPEIMIVLAPKQFWVSGAIVLGLCLTACFQGLSLIVGAGPIFTKKTWWNTATYSIGVLLSTSVLILTFPFLGLVALGWAQVIGSLCSMLMLWIVSEQIYCIRIRKVFLGLYLPVLVSLMIILTLFELGFGLRMTLALAVIGFFSFIFRQSMK